MSDFATKKLGDKPDHLAPDGSEVRLLVKGRRGDMAHFRLRPGHVSIAVAHKSVEEIWFFLSGEGEFWRKLNDFEEVVSIRRNMSISIPPKAHFQFRSLGHEPLQAVAVTMPPWPGADEAEPVPGKWPATVSGEAGD